ncbi:MAG: anaerobic ribonucleoside-triphosphate reductase activating protein [Synergistaceae bacterium]|jgi:anaerobic ribonucleoside-triphosphate reductase activating protein|nr:anaerobic ribonucleoside-triphosphate reductase activating protein [Synergistaceae bacterium]
MRLAGIVPESIVDGPGMRYVVFTQGCPHCCPGCHNPHTHDPSGGFDISPGELVSRFLLSARENPLLDGLTISGGEPLTQARELLPLADAAGEEGLNIWLYTGYTIEEIRSRGNWDDAELLRRVDALVDGRFIESMRTMDAPFKGSSNQRIIKSPVLYIHTT